MLFMLQSMTFVVMFLRSGGKVNGKGEDALRRDAYRGQRATYCTPFWISYLYLHLSDCGTLYNLHL